MIDLRQERTTYFDFHHAANDTLACGGGTTSSSARSCP
jgi:hypothetical protein